MIDLLLTLFLYAIIILFPCGMLAWLFIDVAIKWQRYKTVKRLRGLLSGGMLDMFLEFYELSKEIVEKWEKDFARRVIEFE